MLRNLVRALIAGGAVACVRAPSHPPSPPTEGEDRSLLAIGREWPLLKKAFERYCAQPDQAGHFYCSPKAVAAPMQVSAIGQGLYVGSCRSLADTSYTFRYDAGGWSLVEASGGL